MTSIEVTTANDAQTGLFISFEGLDGSGKTTQLLRCADALRQAGRDVVITRNPGGTALGQQLREMLLHAEAPVAPTTELLLFVADRAQHLQEIVLPALNIGAIVLCDRYHDSSLAYQGYGRGLDLEMIRMLNAIAMQGHSPDMTFFFDGDPAALAARVQTRGAADRLEGEPLVFRQKVRSGFQALANVEPQRIHTIDALLSIDVQHIAVMELLTQHLPALTITSGSP